MPLMVPFDQQDHHVALTNKKNTFNTQYYSQSGAWKFIYFFELKLIDRYIQLSLFTIGI